MYIYTSLKVLASSFSQFYGFYFFTVEEETESWDSIAKLWHHAHGFKKQDFISPTSTCMYYLICQHISGTFLKNVSTPKYQDINHR